AAETSGAGCGRGGLRRSIVGLGQVAQRDRRGGLVDGQGASGVGSRVVRIVQRGDNSVAAGVGRRGGRSVVRDRHTAQTGRAGGGGGGLWRSVIGLCQVAQGDRRRAHGDGQRAGGVGCGVGRIVQRSDNVRAADPG